MNKVSARWVPHMLSLDDLAEREREQFSADLLEMYDRDHPDFEKRLVTGDECRVYYYDPETKFQSSQWKTPVEPTPIKFKTQKSAGKVMGIFFWDTEGVVLLEYLPPHTTVTGQYYAGVLARLHDALKNNRKGKLHKPVFLL